MWYYPLCVMIKPVPKLPKPPSPVDKKLPKPTHPSPKAPKKYNDYSVKINLNKWNHKPQGF